MVHKKLDPWIAMSLCVLLVITMCSSIALGTYKATPPPPSILGTPIYTEVINQETGLFSDSSTHVRLVL